jgi:hypothetical protein
VVQVIERLLCNCKVLSLNPSPIKKKKQKKKNNNNKIELEMQRGILHKIPVKSRGSLGNTLKAYIQINW